MNESKGCNSGLAGFRAHGKSQRALSGGSECSPSKHISVESQHCPAQVVLGQGEDALQGNPLVLLAE